MFCSGTADNSGPDEKDHRIAEWGADPVPITARTARRREKPSCYASARHLRIENEKAMHARTAKPGRENGKRVDRMFKVRRIYLVGVTAFADALQQRRVPTL
jgi:hypothetical protein